MKPLYLCRIQPLCRNASRLKNGMWQAAMTLLMGALALSGARAQDRGDNAVTPAMLAGQNSAVQTPSPSAPLSVNFRERPRYASDTQRLRRTPQIDGVLADGEWDPFYTVNDGPIRGTVYCNWDNNYLYVATRTDQPASLVVDVDASDDGWLRGADNLEVVVGSVADNTPITVAARLLDAANSKDAPYWSNQALDVKSILVSGRTVNGTQVIEMAIPKNMGSLVLRPGANIGLRVDFLPSGPAYAYSPTAPYEPHLLLDATLAEARTQAAAGINPYLTLSDYKCVSGQRLFATLDLRNQLDLSTPVRSVLWEGQGASSGAVDMLREVSVSSIPANGRLRLTYKTILPAGLAPGSYTLAVTAELADGKQVQSSASFSVVEPIQPQVMSDPDPLTVVGTTKLDVKLSIYSAVPDHFRGELELTKAPDDWQLQGGRRRSVVVYGEDATSVSHLVFKLPASTPAGDYPIEMRITWYGRNWDLRHVVHVQGNVAASVKSK